MSYVGDDKRVLMVCFRFRPTRGAGHLRSRKFAKYLGDFGWRPTILTHRTSVGKAADDDSADVPVGANVIDAAFHDPLMWVKRFLGFDPEKDTRAQLERAESVTDGPSGLGTRVMSALLSFTKNWVAFPDREITWVAPAVVRGLRELRSTPHQVIYSSSPPPSTHIVAYLLKKLTGLLWVADFRDLWSQNEFLDRSLSRRKVESILERLVMRNADCIVTVSDSFKEMLESFHGNGKEVVVISNGFDPDDYPQDVKPEEDRMVITYTGNLYGLERDPRPVISLMDEIVSGGEVDEEDIRIRFYSNWEPALEEYCEKMRNPSVVELHGLIPRDEAIRKQKESTVLLAIMMDNEFDRHGQSSKVLEYIGAGRPVLVWAPAGGIVEELIETTGAGAVATNTEGLGKILREWIDAFKTTGRIECPGNSMEIERYNRKTLTGSLAGVLEKLSVRGVK